jgi:hypothetical protein
VDSIKATRKFGRWGLMRLKFYGNWIREDS